MINGMIKKHEDFGDAFLPQLQAQNKRVRILKLR